MKEKRFSLAQRFIHWAIAVTILFLLLTIFLRMGWMNKDHMATIIQESLRQSGTDISTKDATAIAKSVRKPMWNWHILAGYTLIGLYLIRMIITAVQGIAFKNPFSNATSGGDKFKSWLYIVFYILLGVSLFTGFMIVNGPKYLKDNMEMIHVKSLYYVVIFIIIHIGGVLIADAGTEKGIVSRMVSGDKSE